MQCQISFVQKTGFFFNLFSPGTYFDTYFDRRAITALLTCVLLIFIGMISFPTSAAAIYDQIAFDISAGDGTLKFSFTPDYKQDQNMFSTSNDIKTFNALYLAALIGQDIYFLNRTNGVLGIEPFTPGVEPRPFTEDHGSEALLGSFDVPILQDVNIFAGTGSSVEDFLTSGSFVQLYDGRMPDLPQPSKDWTVMVYMVGSNLEGGLNSKKRNASKDIMQMLSGSKALSNDSINIVLSTGGSKRKGWERVKRSFIQNGILYPMKDLGTLNMGESEVLSDFVIWSKNNFPAKHHALILWSHGYGTQGFGGDANYSNNEGKLKFPRLNQAYKTISENSDKPLDIILYDACLMGTIEVAQVTSIAAGAMGASADTEPGFGMDYDTLIKGVESENITNGIEFGKKAMNSYIKECEANGKYEGSNTAITYSIIDLDKLDPFNTHFETFILSLNALITDPSSNFNTYSNLSRGLVRTTSYPIKGYEGWLKPKIPHLAVDLVGYLKHIGSIINEVKSETDTLINTILGPPSPDGDGFQGGLVAAYQGNIDRFTGIDENAGRLSIDVGVSNDYIKNSDQPDNRYLPSVYDDLNDTMTAYFNRRLNDMSEVGTTIECPDGLDCAADPNWLKITDITELLGLSAWLCDYDSKNNQENVLQIKQLYQGEAVKTKQEHILPKEEHCRYQLCIDDKCEWITVTEKNGMLTAEAVINGVNSVLSFESDGADRWITGEINQYMDETWLRGEEIMTGDTVTPIQITLTQDNNAGDYDVPGKSNSDSSFTVQDINTVHLRKVCDVEAPAVTIALFGNNGVMQYHEVCYDETSCFFSKEGEEDTCPGIKILPE